MRGTKLHRGVKIVPYTRDDGELVVDTRCGNQMTAWEDGQRPPASRVEDACKTCFREDMWEAYVNDVKGEEQRKLARRLDEIADTASLEDWGAIKIVQEIRGLSATLVPAQPDTISKFAVKATKESHLKLVGNGAA